MKKSGANQSGKRLIKNIDKSEEESNHTDILEDIDVDFNLDNF